MLDGRKHAVGHQYLPGPGIRAQAGSEIRHAADGGVVEAALEADPAESRKALGDTDSDREVVSLTTPPLRELGDGIAKAQRRPDRPLGRVVVREPGR